MRLPRVTLSIACVMTVLPLQSLNAEPMGQTSRTTVQIVASVAPRILISELSDPPLQTDGDRLCIRANSPVQSYSVTSVDGSGVQRPVAAASASPLCGPIPGFSTATLQSTSNAKSKSAPTMLLVAPE